MKTCRTCKKQKNESEFARSYRTKDGLIARCKSCFNQRSRELYIQHAKDPQWREKWRAKDKLRAPQQHSYYVRNRDEIRKRQKEWYQTLDGKYHAYKNGAYRRKIAWQLTKEDFVAFWQKPCFYCGEPIQTVGIDRKMNKKGYTMENCVSCCTTCNVEYKGDKDIDVFMAHLKKIIKLHSAF